MAGGRLAVLLALMAAGAAPAASPRSGGARLERLHAAADRALAVEPLARVEALPEPFGWLLMVAGFGLLGALLREHRPAEQGGTFDPTPRG